MKALCISLATPSGVGYRREWLLILPNGMAGVGPWYDDGPSLWLTPGDRATDRVIDSSDIESIRRELAEFGQAHMRSYLCESGMAMEVHSRRFNRCTTARPCIDVQLESGLLPIGVRAEYYCPALEIRWTSETA